MLAAILFCFPLKIKILQELLQKFLAADEARFASAFILPGALFVERVNYPLLFLPLNAKMCKTNEHCVEPYTRHSHSIFLNVS